MPQRAESPAAGHSGKVSHGGIRKKVSKKWSYEEQSKLLSMLSGADANTVVWSDIARRLPGRSGKQCREKWKNDVRPDICKDPWSAAEEFTLARAHAEVGNQWAEIARLMPARSENSMKNLWNATLRSKAESKARTFLWLYGQVVLAQGGMTSRASLEAATLQYQRLGHSAPEQLASMVAASDALFAAGGATPGPGGLLTLRGGDGTPVKVKACIKKLRRASCSSPGGAMASGGSQAWPRTSGGQTSSGSAARGRRRQQGSSSASSDEDEDDEEECGSDTEECPSSAQGQDPEEEETSVGGGGSGGGNGERQLCAPPTRLHALRSAALPPPVQQQPQQQQQLQLQLPGGGGVGGTTPGAGLPPLPSGFGDPSRPRSAPRARIADAAPTHLQQQQQPLHLGPPHQQQQQQMSMRGHPPPASHHPGQHQQQLPPGQAWWNSPQPQLPPAGADMAAAMLTLRSASSCPSASSGAGSPNMPHMLASAPPPISRFHTAPAGMLGGSASGHAGGAPSSAYLPAALDALFGGDGRPSHSGGGGGTYFSLPPSPNMSGAWPPPQRQWTAPPQSSAHPHSVLTHQPRAAPAPQAAPHPWGAPPQLGGAHDAGRDGGTLFGTTSNRRPLSSIGASTVPEPRRRSMSCNGFQPSPQQQQQLDDAAWQTLAAPGVHTQPPPQQFRPLQGPAPLPPPAHHDAWQYGQQYDPRFPGGGTAPQLSQQYGQQYDRRRPSSASAGPSPMHSDGGAMPMRHLGPRSAMPPLPPRPRQPHQMQQPQQHPGAHQQAQQQQNFRYDPQYRIDSPERAAAPPPPPPLGMFDGDGADDVGDWSATDLQLLADLLEDCDTGPSQPAHGHHPSPMPLQPGASAAASHLAPPPFAACGSWGGAMVTPRQAALPAGVVRGMARTPDTASPMAQLVRCDIVLGGSKAKEPLTTSHSAPTQPSVPPAASRHSEEQYDEPDGYYAVISSFMQDCQIPDAPTAMDASACSPSPRARGAPAEAGPSSQGSQGSQRMFDCAASLQASETQLEASSPFRRQGSAGLPPHLLGSAAAFKPSVGRSAIAVAASLLCRGVKSVSSAALLYPSTAPSSGDGSGPVGDAVSAFARAAPGSKSFTSRASMDGAPLPEQPVCKLQRRVSYT